MKLNYLKRLGVSNRALIAVFGAGLLPFVAVSNVSANTVDDNAKAPEAKSETIVVTGIKRSLADSRAVKSKSLGIVDAISAQEIGKFPDTNVAESLQRITGVSIDRTGGEGQSITVRGFGPDFNTVLVNGRQVASEAEGRSFSFDTIASELVAGLEVYKTSEAVLPSGGVGSTVNVKTARPFDFKGFKLVGSAKGSYEDVSGKTSPQVSFLVSDTFADGKFGALLAVSHQERKDRLNQAQTDGWLENAGIPQAQINGGAGFNGTVFSPRNFDTKVTFEDRVRDNANLVLQYRPNNNLKFTLDYLYSKFDVKTDATSFGHWFTGPNTKNVKLDSNGTVTDLYQEIGLATDFHSKKFDRLTETSLIGLNADWDVSDKLKLSFDATHTNATRDPNNGGADQLSLIGYANRVRFQTDGSFLPWTSGFDTANPNIWSGQQANFDNVVGQPGQTPAGVSNYLNPANLRAHVMLRRGWAVDDTSDQFKVNGTWFEGNEQGLSRVRFGASNSKETKELSYWSNEPSGVHCTYCGYPDSPVIPASSVHLFNAGSDFLGGVSGHDRLFTQWLAHDGEAQFAYLEKVSGKNFDAVKTDKSFAVTENTTAAYVQLDFAGTLLGKELSTVVGTRYEYTDVSVDGIESPIESLKILDQTEMLAQYGTKKAVTANSNYDIWLPNMSAKWKWNNNLTLRAAYSKTITRPTLQSMAPVTVIGTTRPGGNLTATSGNPDLKPFISDNFDLSAEYYYGTTNYISLGVFNKSVNNFIVSNAFDETFKTSNGSLLKDPSTGTNPLAADAADTVAVFTVTKPVNGESANVKGLELAVQHAFGSSGFGVIANATLVTSDAKLNPADITQKFAITGLSNSYNLVGYYEKNGLQLRAAYNYRDAFLLSLAQKNGDGVTNVDAYGQLDLSGSYKFNDNFSVFFEGTNVTNSVIKQYGRFKNQFLLAEESGPRWAIGFRMSY